MKRTALPPRWHPLARASQKHRAQQASQRRAYATASDAKQPHCSVCGAAGARLEHSHHFTQKAYPEHRNNPLNWQLQCADCHRLWEHNKPAFATAYPAAWVLILERMRQVDARAYAYFRMRHSY